VRHTPATSRAGHGSATAGKPTGTVTRAASHVSRRRLRHSGTGPRERGYDARALGALPVVGSRAESAATSCGHVEGRLRTSPWPGAGSAVPGTPVVSRVGEARKLTQGTAGSVARGAGARWTRACGTPIARSGA